MEEKIEKDLGQLYRELALVLLHASQIRDEIRIREGMMRMLEEEKPDVRFED